MPLKSVLANPNRFWTHTMRALKMTFHSSPRTGCALQHGLLQKKFGTAFNSVAPGIALNGVLRRREA